MQHRDQESGFAGRRGRPPKFSDAERQQLMDLIRQHGARGAQRMSTIPVSLATLLKVAQTSGIQLRRGRRRAA